MQLVLFSLRDGAQLLGFIGIAALAIKYGKAPERYCAAVPLIMKAADLVFHLMIGRAGVTRTLEFGHLTIDVGVAIAYIAIMLAANRVYPIWLSSIQLISVMAHFADYLGQSAQRPYAVMAVAPSYLEMLVTVIGILSERRRQLRGMDCRPWRRQGQSLEPELHG